MYVNSVVFVNDYILRFIELYKRNNIIEVYLFNITKFNKIIEAVYNIV